MNRHRYTEHRIRTSLERHLPCAPTSDERLRKLVADAREAGVIVFLQEDLASLAPVDRASLAPVDRAIIEGAAERFAKGHR